MTKSEKYLIGIAPGFLGNTYIPSKGSRVRHMVVPEQIILDRKDNPTLIPGPTTILERLAQASPEHQRETRFVGLATIMQHHLAQGIVPDKSLIRYYLQSRVAITTNRSIETNERLKSYFQLIDTPDWHQSIKEIETHLLLAQPLQEQAKSMLEKKYGLRFKKALTTKDPKHPLHDIAMRTDDEPLFIELGIADQMRNVAKGICAFLDMPTVEYAGVEVTTDYHEKVRPIKTAVREQLLAPLYDGPANSPLVTPLHEIPLHELLERDRLRINKQDGLKTILQGLGLRIRLLQRKNEALVNNKVLNDITEMIAIITDFHKIAFSTSSTPEREDLLTQQVNTVKQQLQAGQNIELNQKRLIALEAELAEQKILFVKNNQGLPVAIHRPKYVYMSQEKKELALKSFEELLILKLKEVYAFADTYKAEKQPATQVTQ